MHWEATQRDTAQVPSAQGEQPPRSQSRSRLQPPAWQVGVSMPHVPALQTAREQVDGTGTDGFAIEWDDLPDRSMIFGEKEAAPPA